MPFKSHNIKSDPQFLAFVTPVDSWLWFNTDTCWLICLTLLQGISEDLHPHRSPAAEAKRSGPAARGRRPLQVRATHDWMHLKYISRDFPHCETAVYLHWSRLLLLEGGPGSPSCLLGGKHSVSWGFEDMLPTPDNSAGGTESKGKRTFWRPFCDQPLHM